MLHFASIRYTIVGRWIGSSFFLSSEGGFWMEDPDVERWGSLLWIVLRNGYSKFWQRTKTSPARFSWKVRLLERLYLPNAKQNFMRGWDLSELWGVVDLQSYVIFQFVNLPVHLHIKRIWNRTREHIGGKFPAFLKIFYSQCTCTSCMKLAKNQIKSHNQPKLFSISSLF